MADFDTLFPNVGTGRSPADYTSLHQYQSIKNINAYKAFIMTHYMKVSNRDRCIICGRYTNWVSIDFHEHICSEECEKALYDEASPKKSSRFYFDRKIQ